jgi:putative transposase
MPRRPRLALAGHPHHLIQRGNNRQAIFFDEADRRFFLARLGEALAAHGCALHAYVLMTNHLHLLITPQTDEAIGRLMQALGRRYVGHVNRLYGRTGTLWEGRFKSTIIDSDRYLMACHRYIEANPVRAGMVLHPRDHRWSSWGHNGEGHADGLVTEHELYRALGRSTEARCLAYRELFAQGLDEATLGAMRDAAQRGWVAGDESFRQRIEKVLGRRLAAPVRGRPRKEQAGGDVSGEGLLL